MRLYFVETKKTINFAVIMQRVISYTLFRAIIVALIVLMSVMTSGRVVAQSVVDKKIDSLINVAMHAPDSLAAELNNDICWKLRNINPEIAIQYGMKGLDFAKRTNNILQEVKAYAFLGVCQRNLDNFDEALKYYKLGIEKAVKFNVEEQLGYGYINLGNLLIYQNKFTEAENQLKMALPIAQKLGDSSVLAYAYLNLGRARLGIKDFDKSEEFFQKAISIRTECKKLNKSVSVPKKYLADCHSAAGLTQLALQEYFCISNIYYSDNALKNYDSAFYYANQSLKYARNIGSKKAISESYGILAEIYKKKKDYKGLNDCYIRQMECYDSLFKKQVEQQTYNIKYSADTYTKQLEIESLNNEKSLRSSINMMSIIILLIVAAERRHARRQLRDYLIHQLCTSHTKIRAKHHRKFYRNLWRQHGLLRSQRNRIGRLVPRGKRKRANHCSGSRLRGGRRAWLIAQHDGYEHFQGYRQ